MDKVIVITGGTSGIGLQAARELSQKGCRVYELSRGEDGTDAAVHIQADVTDEDQVRRAIEQILEREKHIDVVINNAGFGISGAIEYTDTEEAKRQFDVNFFGMVRVNRAVLPIMHRQGYGRILNMSSVAAPIAIPFQAYYSASKAAVRTYTVALYSEVKPYGIEVCAIMGSRLPGERTRPGMRNTAGAFPAASRSWSTMSRRGSAQRKPENMWRGRRSSRRCRYSVPSAGSISSLYFSPVCFRQRF